MISPDTEIRKLRPAEFCTLAKTLSPDFWKDLLAVIINPDDGNPLFTAEHVKMIEYAATKERSAAEIFLDEWGTTGRIRPTIQSLIHLLVKCELFRAADYLAVDLLKQSAPVRPVEGPAAAVEIPDDLSRFLKAREDCEFDSETGSHDIRSIELNYAENKYIDRRYTEENEASNKIPVKFDGISVEKCDLNRDFIKFSDINYSNSIRMPDELNSEEIPPFILAKNQISRELSSNELPICVLEQNEILDELTSAELPLCINAQNKITEKLISQDLDDKNSENYEYELPSELSSGEIPLCIKK